MEISRRSVALLVTPLLLFALLPVLSAGKATTAQAASSTTFAFGWGDNDSGQQGNGLVADDSVAVAVGSGANTAGTWQQMAASWQSSASCGIGGDDSAYCWGPNGLGQVGDGTKVNRYGGPVLVSAGANTSGSWKSITVGGEFWTCGIGGDDRGYCWGYNDQYGNAATPGFLGNGTAKTTDDSIPRLVSNGANASGTWKTISAGWPVTCGIATNDLAYCWGPNNTGALGNGTVGFSTDDSVPRQVSNGANTAGTWASVSVGNKFACGIGTNTRLYCWGQLVSGGSSTTPVLLGSGANINETWKSVSSGKDRACGVGQDDRAYCWGYGPTGDGTINFSAAPVKVALPGDPPVTAVGTSRWSPYFSCALASGSVYCWGSNARGQLGDGQQPTDSNAPVLVASSGVLAGRAPLALSVGEDSVFLITGPGSAAVTYDPNQATSGNPPPTGSGAINSTFTVAGNSGSLARSGYTFAGWNTNDQGTGTTYAAGTGTFTLTGDTTLYAKWQALPPPPPVPSPPGPPYLLTAEPGNRQVTLTWAPPDWPGTSPVTTYRVYAATGGLACTTATTTCTVTGLTNGQPYEFWVTAINAVGESAPSRRLTATPRPDPPGAPFLATVTGGNAQAIVAWDPPASDGGAPVTEYRVFTGSGTRACTVAALTEQCTVTGLTNGQRYEFWVTAVNAAGESAPSRRLSVIPALALPGEPLDVAGTAGDKRIHWAWKPPESDGSYPVERYQVILNPLLPTVGGIACTVTVPENSCTVAKLNPGTTYTARVRAWSKAGWGPWSTSSTGIKVPLPPPPGISVEVRRLSKDPDEVRVKGRTQGIKPGTELWVWIHRETEYGYLDSFQGTSRPVVEDDGTFTWERSAPQGRIWEVIWCTQPNVKGICSRWTLV